MNSIIVEQSLGLKGSVEVSGAKNAVLVEIASLILIDGVSILKNVPDSEDVYSMCSLLEDLGAQCSFNPILKELKVDTSTINKFEIQPERMKKMRASILVLGPLLARFLKAKVSVPGGCVLGARPIDYHIKNFERMGVRCEFVGDYLFASAEFIKPSKIVLEYPSVGATENILMCATLIPGETIIVNAALEPEVIDLINLLLKSGADIEITSPMTIKIRGVESLRPVFHEVMFDRLEAGSLLIAAAATGGLIQIPNADANQMEVFLYKLEEMGHVIDTSLGIKITASSEPKAVSFKTSPYPSFPTDLQAPMTVLQCLSSGRSVIEETVFENRLLHCFELNKMGANILVNGTTAIVEGKNKFMGASVVGTDIRAACALVIAGMVATGTTYITGLHHLKRGYDNFDLKLRSLGANITFVENDITKVYFSEKLK
jgi:UDP-N-acetylglucosamine 1-carboxyvinyltransferase